MARYDDETEYDPYLEEAEYDPYLDDLYWEREEYAAMTEGEMPIETQLELDYEDELKYKDEVSEKLIAAIDEYLEFSTVRDLIRFLATIL
jgi:hypothetical protein